MVNRKKRMTYYVLWIEREEENEITKIFKKKIKSSEDLRLLGYIFSRINLRGDFRLG